MTTPCGLKLNSTDTLMAATHEPPKGRGRGAGYYNPLYGITFGRWLAVLKTGAIELRRPYIGRAALVTCASMANTLCRGLEHALYGRRIHAATVRMDPVFVLGHWRSGTTYLHNLLAVDPRHVCPSTFQVVNPSTFLITEKGMARLLAALLPNHRPMDAVPVTFDSPQEDELAVALISGLSPYMSFIFPKEDEHYDKYITFADVSVHERDRWRRSLLQFLRKLSVGEVRRVILKSPAHTARIGMLLEMFPEARFVHIHRNPYEVFKSCQLYYRVITNYANLQSDGGYEFDRVIIRRYRMLYDAYLAQRELIPPGRLREVSYAALVRDPRREMSLIYEGLGLGAFEPAGAKFDAYMRSVADYRCNMHSPLTAFERRRVQRAWKPYFKAFGYSVH